MVNNLHLSRKHDNKCFIKDLLNNYAGENDNTESTSVMMSCVDSGRFINQLYKNHMTDSNEVSSET